MTNRERREYSESILVVHTNAEFTIQNERILIIGNSASGKTTFARRLGRAVQLPVIELDELYWSPDWQAKSLDEFSRLIDSATAGPAWIADGNYGSARQVLWPRATLAIWLNYSFPCVFGRGIRRTVRRAWTREPLWHGNRESFRKSFLSHDSILLWIITTHRRRQREFRELRAGGRFPNLRWIEFTHPSLTEAWVRDIEQHPSPHTAEACKTATNS